jgi:hypothetical protein
VGIAGGSSADVAIETLFTILDVLNQPKSEIPTMTKKQALEKARKRWGPKAFVCIRRRWSWRRWWFIKSYYVGIEGFAGIPYWQAMGIGDTWAAAFAFADEGQKAHESTKR